ncbi:WcaF family extracellular polysaccharide biosynthesis acetyltransferase [Marinilabilia salmonicolor]|jgi:putative colanic acid biosynthesis acetyltransferase WcaF|uniref:Putative colanic acid biosynthesis acetyltransferase WcaF n=1 Tax=Marinilabilia salmonicolor TaxID=989 RepID=A0A2T0XGW7_9BACT|nr:WcaF family extracellular polysaccharide biosynthesis acetyltransferase [Marinilabilia salmonicolor]PRY98194.1 putative colanic acid biosynthesis acetyltransferase WcaF [Marinilabilia salmonicolor]RCW27475.1 putative colanic acid biosynthesis acetyltransferase WcaF [Marinilabilia salmonicolor]
MQVDLSKYDNSWFHPGRGILIRTIWHFVNSLFFNNGFFPVSSLKVFLLRLFGAKIGRGVVVKPRVNIKYPWNLRVGDHTWIGEEVWIDNLTKVKIGSNCCLSQGALLLCGNHDYRKETFDLMVGEIVLEDGVWIGANAIVPGNAVCHTHSVLAVHSVAPAIMEPFTIYRGNPATAVKKRI